MIVAKYEKEKWSLFAPEETSLASMKTLSVGTLTLMQVSTLRGIVETEQQLDAAKDMVSKLSDHQDMLEMAEQLDAAKDMVSKLSDHQDMLEMAEQVISKVLAWKKHEAEISYYLRTGRFPE